VIIGHTAGEQAANSLDLLCALHVTANSVVKSLFDIGVGLAIENQDESFQRLGVEIQGLLVLSCTIGCLGFLCDHESHLNVGD